jgi:hypothetical protein
MAATIDEQHPHLVLYSKEYLNLHKDDKEIIPCNGDSIDRKSLPNSLLLDSKYTKLLKPFDTITTHLDISHPEKEHLTTGRIITNSNDIVGDNYAFHAFTNVSQNQWVCKYSAQIPAFIGYIFHKNIPTKTLTSVEIIPKSSRTYGSTHFTHAPKTIRIQGTMQSSSDSSVQWQDIPQSKMTIDRNNWKHNTKYSIVLPRNITKYHGYRLVIHDWYTYPDPTDTSEYASSCGLNHIHFTFKEDSDQVVLPTFDTGSEECIFAIDYRPFTVESTVTKECFEQMAVNMEQRLLASLATHDPLLANASRLSTVEHLVREDMSSTSLQDTDEMKRTFIYYSRSIATPSTPLTVYLLDVPKPFTYRVYVNYQRNNSDVLLKIPEGCDDSFVISVNNAKYGEGREISLKGYGSYVMLHYYSNMWHGILYNSYIKIPS